MVLAVGTRVGPYVLDHVLGVGGMGETYAAYDHADHGQRVCLKIVRRDLIEDPRFLALFLDEMRLHAQLRHKNIVGVLGSGEAESGYYLVMELVEGRNLEQLMRFATRNGERLSILLSAYVLRELSEALFYAHSLEIDGAPQHVVHRDVSPSNVLVDGKGDVLLTDFGIARAQTRNHHTTAGIVRGKLGYMSPEQLRGAELDSRSDLFALGILAFELFAGSHPFIPQKEDTSDILAAHHILANVRPSILQVAPWLPGNLADLVECLLAPDPALRPASAASVRDVIERYGVPQVVRDELGELVRRCLGASSPAGESVPTASRTRATPGSHQVIDRARAPQVHSVSALPSLRTPSAKHADLITHEVSLVPQPTGLEVAASDSELEVVEQDGEHVAAVWRNVLILVWVSCTRATHVSAARLTLRRLAESYPGGIGLVQVIEKDCNRLDGEAREAFAQLYGSETAIRCSAIVMEGSGFRAASVRMIVAALARVSGSVFPHRLFSDVTTAALWEAELLEHAMFTADELSTAVAQVRAFH